MKRENCNRRLFAEIVLPSFVGAYTYPSKIYTVRSVYDKFIKKLEEDKISENQLRNAERRKILENCLNLFTNVKNKKRIDKIRDKLKREINQDMDTDLNPEREPSDKEFALKIIEAISEHVLKNFPADVLGDGKRKYDMSDKYRPDIVRTVHDADGTLQKDVDLIPFAHPHTESHYLEGNFGQTISLRKIGVLTYKNAIGTERSVDQYSVTISLNDPDEIDNEHYIVFTNIDSDKIDIDSAYRQIVVRELLSKNNIELANAGHYIGELVDTKRTIGSPSLTVRQELNQEGSDYRCQVSEQYALLYNYEDLSAVIDYGIQEAQKVEKAQEPQPNKSEGFTH